LHPWPQAWGASQALAPFSGFLDKKLKKEGNTSSHKYQHLNYFEENILLSRIGKYLAAF
jgi:hypothetical protein